MTHGAFLTSFEHALRVVEPQRTELIEEVRGHLDDVGNLETPEDALGEPRDLAYNLNRVHIGLFHTRLRLFGAPVVLTLIVTGLTLLVRQDPTQLVTAPQGIGYYLATIFVYFAPFILLTWLGVAIGRTHQTKRYFWLLLSECVGLILIYSLMQTFMSSAGAVNGWGIFLVLPLLGYGGILIAIILLTASLLQKPVRRMPNPENLGMRLYVELLIMSIVSVFTFVIAKFGTAFLIPFDIALERPPKNTVISIVNDFFENGEGQHLLVLLVLLALWLIFAKRIRSYAQYWNPACTAWTLAFTYGTLLTTTTLTEKIPLSIPAVLAVIFCGSLSLLYPQRPWRWALAVVLCVPVIQFITQFFGLFDGYTPSAVTSIFLLPLGLLGAYLGTIPGKFKSIIT